MVSDSTGMAEFSCQSAENILVNMRFLTIKVEDSNLKVNNQSFYV